MRGLLLFLLLVWGAVAGSQPPADSVRLDSLPAADSLLATDSTLRDSAALRPPVVKDSLRLQLLFPFESDSFRYRPQLFYRFTDPIRYTVSERQWVGKEMMFYAVVFLLLLFAFIRNSSGRYLSDLFSSYFRTTLRQKQVKEQLLQSPLPSLLFNAFFVLSTGVFAALLLNYFGQAPPIAFWLLALYCAAALALIYLGKFVLLKFMGWVFQQTEATDTYIFVVFATNKVLGIALLPLTVLLAFNQGPVATTVVTLAVVLVGLLFLYRFFLSYLFINHSVRLSPFHFLLYLAAFEVVPLLLINKLLFTILRDLA